MRRLYSSAKNIVSYFKLRKRMKFEIDDPIEKIHNFYKELVAMGIIPNTRLNNTAGTVAEAKFDGRTVLMFASNDYLGLSKRESVIDAVENELDKHGLGPGGSRFLCGDIDLLATLDKKTAELVGTEDAITFPTGYMANNGVFQAVMDPLIGSLPFKKGSGVIFSDEYNHGSIVEGCRLSHAKKVIFRHNDMKDLRAKIIEHINCFPKMIVTEGVFTPHGDIAPLHELVKISKEVGAILMVDDAHGVGILGKKGGGTVQQLGLEGQIDIIMGSFDKALGGMGGFLAGKKKLIEYFRVSAHPYMLSSSVPGIMAGGLIEAMNICMSENSLRETLFQNANYIRLSLEKEGFKILGSESVPVVLVYIGDELKSIKFSDMIFDKGIYCPSFRWPVVPHGESRMRITPMATHSIKHLDALVSVFVEVGKEMNII